LLLRESDAHCQQHDADAGATYHLGGGVGAPHGGTVGHRVGSHGGNGRRGRKLVEVWEKKKKKKKKRGRGRQLRRGGKLLVWFERKGRRGRGRKWDVLIPKELGLCTPAICRRPLYFFSAILAIVHYCQAVVNRKLGGEQSSFGPTSPFGLRVVGRSAGTHPSHPTDFNRSQNFPPNKITVKTMSRSNLLSVAFQSSNPGFFAPSQCLAVAA